ncbi:hypothetical protein [Streptomyces sp. NPDC098781]|uniref:hypothetical protein n=1 Tax=Streptomyces sp. NPDC098781 TaxID=3366097 RepID=UPI0038295581
MARLRRKLKRRGAKEVLGVDISGEMVAVAGKFEESETGARCRITALLEPAPVSFVATCPRREVYEDSLRAAGFRELTWVPLEVSEDGVHEFGADFWADLLANPPLETLRCRA